MKFNYPEGIFILAGIGLLLVANFLLPMIGYDSSSAVLWTTVAGVGLMFVGMALLVIDFG